MGGAGEAGFGGCITGAMAGGGGRGPCSEGKGLSLFIIPNNPIAASI